LIFGDDHGKEAVVGRRDAYWASRGSTVTSSWLLLVESDCSGTRQNNAIGGGSVTRLTYG
jgi:hypothetical protein